MKWTKFRDSYTGGNKKLDWEVIYIRGDRDLAVKKFEEIFDIYPLADSCECCYGPDYHVTEQDDDPQDHEHEDVLVMDSFGANPAPYLKP